MSARGIDSESLCLPGVSRDHDVRRFAKARAHNYDHMQIDDHFTG